MAFQAQHQRKCYCNNLTCSCCCRGPTQTPTATTKHTLSSLRQKGRTKSEKFVKIRRFNDSNVNGRGLGHSHNVGGSTRSNNNNFSRRNSAATSTTTTSTDSRTTLNSKTTNASSYKSVRLQVGAGDHSDSSLLSTPCGTPTKSSKYEMTARRSYYERCKESSAQAHSDIIDAWTSRGGGITSATPTASPIDERIYALQQWRMKNPDECFSVYRQNDLKMQQRLKSANSAVTFLPTSASCYENKFCSNFEPHCNNIVTGTQPSSLPPHKSDLKTLTPYAVRQKLLQLRLQADAIAEHKPGHGQRLCYAVPDKSCALRYQETY